MAIHPDFPNFFHLDHPLIQDKLSQLRETARPPITFRGLLHEIALLMTYEITRDLPTGTRTITTPLATMETPCLAGAAPTIVPVLRAGLGMVEAVWQLMPTATIGHIGVYRDHDTHQPVEYLVRLPPDHGQQYIIVDPMLATGNSLVYAADILRKHKIPAERIKALVLVAAPEGVRTFFAKHPDIKVYTAALDEKLNSSAYIVPGLGDAGDRIFGT